MKKDDLLKEIKAISDELQKRKLSQKNYWRIPEKSDTQKNAMGRESYKIASLLEKRTMLLYSLTFLLLRRTCHAPREFSKNTTFTPRSAILL